MYLPLEPQDRFTKRNFLPHHTSYFKLQSKIPQVL